MGRSLRTSEEPEVAVVADEPPRVPARFSAPNNIGPVIEGVAPGDVLAVSGETRNAGRYVVASVDADWMSVTARVIQDEAHAPRALVEVVR